MSEKRRSRMVRKKRKEEEEAEKRKRKMDELPESLRCLNGYPRFYVKESRVSIPVVK